MDIKIGKKGFIKEGEDKGWFLLIQDIGGDEGGGYLILITNKSPDMTSDIGYDGWAKDLEEIEMWFEQSNWVIEWLE